MYFEIDPFLTDSVGVQRVFDRFFYRYNNVDILSKYVQTLNGAQIFPFTCGITGMFNGHENGDSCTYRSPRYAHSF